jgi:hypothetical protein
MRITESKLRRVIRGVIRESYGNYDEFGQEMRPAMPSSKDEVCFGFVEDVISNLEDRGWSVDFNGTQGQDCHALFRKPIRLKKAYGRSIEVVVNDLMKYWADDYYQSLVDDANSGSGMRKSKHFNHIVVCANECIDTWEERNVSLGVDRDLNRITKQMKNSGY